ncbi:hypothetical protein Htur_5011 (plasmid) [Haloterrigena turkmenica DSM 5511]|uniref:Uncharacterized protein n=1 Tax=Haloterrigena turkmenica (strain ATCC 51198 / DSM 5511 / JCM 9101 / NCIMB 13204 / VKM B-1734 / 4k) TaxID=543526 RepID=D2S3F2_HALTV|nr:hypothetical protein [Haloterrigena turkmenica]ADB63899.1 hypothetical protein Htur_5011 [Haloterrigena turkmenica DSM 5511]
MTDSPLVTERALARTYDSRAYADTWDAVDDYRRVRDYAHRNPSKGSSAIASALDLPRGRIRPWLDESKPDAVHGLETAREYGWLDCEFGDPAFTALNTLVANVFSGGSLAEQYYQPSFALNRRGEDSHVLDALELAGVDYRVVDDRDGRADEVRPTDAASVLGRVLSVLGAPVGPKADQHLSLPAYLDEAPTEVRETFAYAYLENRAIEHDGKATLTIREERNRDYLEALAGLLASVAGGGVELGERDIVISADAATALGTVR